MERTFRKAADEAYPQKIFAHQLITIDDLEQFKKQLLEELLTALRKQTGAIPKKWLKSHEVRRLLKSLLVLYKRLSQPVLFLTLKSVVFISMITTIYKSCWN